MPTSAPMIARMATSSTRIATMPTTSSYHILWMVVLHLSCSTMAIPSMLPINQEIKFRNEKPSFEQINIYNSFNKHTLRKIFIFRRTKAGRHQKLGPLLRVRYPKLLLKNLSPHKRRHPSPPGRPSKSVDIQRAPRRPRQTLAERSCRVQVLQDLPSRCFPIIDSNAYISFRPEEPDEEGDGLHHQPVPLRHL